jgi:hypothetical protein
MLVVAVLVAFVYTRLAGEWSEPAFYAGGAGLIALLCALGLPWIEFAPDGAFRKQPRT